MSENAKAVMAGATKVMPVSVSKGPKDLSDDEIKKYEINGNVLYKTFSAAGLPSDVAIKMVRDAIKSIASAEVAKKHAPIVLKFLDDLKLAGIEVPSGAVAIRVVLPTDEKPGFLKIVATGGDKRGRFTPDMFVRMIGHGPFVRKIGKKGDPARRGKYVLSILPPRKGTDSKLPFSLKLLRPTVGGVTPPALFYPPLVEGKPTENEADTLTGLMKRAVGTGSPVNFFGLPKKYAALVAKEEEKDELDEIDEDEDSETEDSETEDSETEETEIDGLDEIDEDSDDEESDDDESDDED